MKLPASTRIIIRAQRDPTHKIKVEAKETEQTISNSGYWLGRFAQQEAKEIAEHHDLELFYAPGECHKLICKRHIAEFKALETEMKTATGLNYEELLEYFKAKGINTYRAYERVIANILLKDICPSSKKEEL